MTAKEKPKMYCVKCRKGFVPEEFSIVTLPKGRSKVPMDSYKAACPRCGTSSYKFIGKKGG